jgi:hypothetical protein
VAGWPAGFRFLSAEAAGEAEAALDGKVGSAVLIGLVEQWAHARQTDFVRYITAVACMGGFSHGVAAGLSACFFCVSTGSVEMTRISVDFYRLTRISVDFYRLTRISVDFYRTSCIVSS